MYTGIYLRSQRVVQDYMKLSNCHSLPYFHLDSQSSKAKTLVFICASPKSKPTMVSSVVPSKYLLTSSTSNGNWDFIHSPSLTKYPYSHTLFSIKPFVVLSDNIQCWHFSCTVVNKLIMLVSLLCSFGSSRHNGFVFFSMSPPQPSWELITNVTLNFLPFV